MQSYALFLLACIATTASAACDREDLKDLAVQYVDAQATGSVEDMPPFIDVATYSENGQAMDVRSGILTQSLNIDHNRSIHDTVQCATFTELIVTDPDHPYVIGTRILYTDDGEISHMESIVTDQGDWLFNATGYLYWNSLEDWDPIPVEKRDTRAVIKAGGDAYFDRFDNVSVQVPFGPTCARLEGGAYTGESNPTGETCSIGGLPSSIKIPYRRYIVDEEYGAVDMFIGFPGLDRSVPDQAMPDSHIFRVEGGKIKWIHTVSSCVNAGCGLNASINGTTLGRRSVKYNHRPVRL
ncbi:hypothetical protein J7T55_005838 [Diaporthe amygdali]|uniref:uncharacterized protein n=1 Tax=Phomopsis amygdali TaxID=1214568 RepID=UPI0022FE432D|nr:uncharacterized protein J7T55_005838 [Diaporthe amygdali]KAJ0124500.1 hypothetical protein J7T55_005838 [Diaporthe amygdali]